MKDTDTDKQVMGLTSQQVEASREKWGENLLTPPAKTSVWRLYIEKYNDPMVKILLVAAVISLVLSCVKGDFMETIGIFLAIFFFFSQQLDSILSAMPHASLMCSPPLAKNRQ